MGRNVEPGTALVFSSMGKWGHREGVDGVGTLSSGHHSAQEAGLTADRYLCCLSGDGQLRDMTRISLPGRSARAGTDTRCFPFPKVSKTFWWGRTKVWKVFLLLFFIIQFNWQLAVIFIVCRTYFAPARLHILLVWFTVWARVIVNNVSVRLSSKRELRPFSDALLVILWNPKQRNGCFDANLLQLHQRLVGEGVARVTGSCCKTCHAVKCHWHPH